MTEDVPFLFLSRDQVTALLDPDAAVASQRAAFGALGAGGARRPDLPGKIMHPSRFDDSVVFAYVSRLSRDTGAVAKFGSVNPGNAAAGLPTIHAVITALDPVTGELAAVMDGTAVTPRCTAAASAVAFDALATADITELERLRSGTQAFANVWAVTRVRDHKSARVWSPTVPGDSAGANPISRTLRTVLSAPPEGVPPVPGVLDPEAATRILCVIRSREASSLATWSYGYGQRRRGGPEQSLWLSGGLARWHRFRRPRSHGYVTRVDRGRRKPTSSPSHERVTPRVRTSGAEQFPNPKRRAWVSSLLAAEIGVAAEGPGLPDAAAAWAVIHAARGEDR